MVKVFSIGKMEVIMMVLGKITKCMVKDRFLTILIVFFMREDGTKTTFRGKVGFTMISLLSSKGLLIIKT